MNAFFIYSKKIIVVGSYNEKSKTTNAGIPKSKQENVSKFTTETPLKQFLPCVKIQNPCDKQNKKPKQSLYYARLSMKFQG